MLKILINKILSFLRTDVFVLAVGKLIQIVLLFLAVRLFTIYLPDAEVGNLILMLTMTMFIGLALVNPVGSFISRELNNWINKKVLYGKFLIFNLYVFCVSVFSFLLPYILSYFGIGKSIPTLNFSIAVSLFVFFNTWNQTIIPALNLLFHRKAFVCFTIVSISMYLVFSLLFVLTFEPTAFWWLIGQLSGLCVGFILALHFMLKSAVCRQQSPEFNIETSGLKRILKFSLPLAVATLMLWVLGNAYKLVIESQFGAEALAYIGLALTLAASLAGAVESLLMQVFHSPFYKGISEAENLEERRAVCQRFLNGTVPISAGAIFIVVCMTPFLLKLLADDRFAIIYPFLMLGLILEFLRVMTNIFSHAAHSEYKTHKNILPYAVGSVIASAGILYSITQARWEYYLIASLLCGWLATVIIMVRNAKKLLNFNLPVIQTFKVIVYLSPVAPLAWHFSGSSKYLIDSLGVIAVTCLFASIVLYRQYLRVIQ